METDEIIRNLEVTRAKYEARVSELEATIDAMEVEHEATVEALQNAIGRQAFEIRSLRGMIRVQAAEADA